MLQKLKNYLKNSRAATAIEFAIIAPAFFLLFVGIVEIGLTVFFDSALNSGIRIAARQGVPSGTDQAKIVQALNSNLGGLYNDSRGSIVVRGFGTDYAATGAGTLSSFKNDPRTLFAGLGVGADSVASPQSNNITIYAVRYKWGGITGLFSSLNLVPTDLYAFSIVKNESY